MQPHRKLAAILSADVVGYSGLMGDDDRATVETLNAYRQIIRHRVERHEGRVVDSPGDAILAEFSSALEAVECAQEIQHELGKRNAQLAEHRRMLVRIGINLGDVIEENSALYGDGVNVSARLESISDASGICISGTVFDQVKGKLPLEFKFLVEQHVKNIAKPVRVYKVLGPPVPSGRGPQWRYWRSSKATVVVLAVALLIAVGSGVWWRHHAISALPDRFRLAPIGLLLTARAGGSGHYGSEAQRGYELLHVSLRDPPHESDNRGSSVRSPRGQPNSSNNALASRRSSVSNPSVNQL